MDGTGGNKKMQKGHARRPRDKKHRKRSKNVKGQEETSGRDERKETIMVPIDNFMDKRQQSLEDSLVFHAEGLIAETGKTGTGTSVTHYNKEMTGQALHKPTPSSDIQYELHNDSPTSDIEDESHDQFTASDIRDRSLDNTMREEFDTSSGEEDIHDNTSKEAVSNEEEEAGRREKERDVLGHQRLREVASEESEDWDTASEENAVFEEVTETVSKNVEMTETDSLQLFKETKSGHLKGTNDNKYCGSEETDADRDYEDTEITYGEDKSITETDCVGKGARYGLNSQEEVREEADSREAVSWEADSREAVSGEADSREAVSGEADSRETVREEADSREAVREEADSREAVREEADSREAVREEADSREAVREEADSREAVREEADSREAVREEADSREAVREEADSREAVREEADSREAVREEADSREAVREEADSREAVREEADSREAVREEADSREAVREEVDSREAVREEADSREAVRKDGDTIVSDSKKTSRKGFRPESKVTFGEKIEADNMTVLEEMEASCSNPLRGEAEVDAKETDRWEAWSTEVVWKESRSDNNLEFGEKMETDRKMQILDTQTEKEETIRNEAVDKKTVGQENPNEQSVREQTQNEEAGDKGTVRREVKAEAKEMVRVEVKETSIEEADAKEMVMEEAIGEKLEAEAKETVRNEMVAIGWDEDVIDAKERVWGEVETETKEIVSEDAGAKETVRKKAEADAKEMVRGEVEAKETADMERETKEMATEEEEAKEMVRDEVEAKQTGDVEGETKEMVSEVEEAKEMVKEEAETDVKETDGEKADSGETNFNVVVNKVEKTALQHEISIVGHKETPREDSRVWTNEVSSGYEINQSDNNMDGGGPVNLNLDIPSNDRNKIGSNNDINARDITSYRGIAKTEIETGEKIFERAKLCEEEETATQYSKNDCQSGDITRDKEEDSALIDQLVKQSISQKEKDEGERGFTLQNLAAEIDGEEELLVLDNQVGHAIRSNLETTSLQEGRPDQDIASGRMVDIASDLAGGEIEPVNATEMVTASKREDQNAVPQGEEAESLCEREDMITVCRIDSEIDKMDIYGKETLSNVKDVWMEGSGLLSEGEKEAINSLRQNVDETDFQKQQSANMWVQEENGKDRGQSLNNVLSSSTIIYGDVVLDLADEHSKNNSQGLDLPCLLKDISLSRYEGDARDPHAVMQRDTEYAGTDLSETSETKIQNPQQHPSKFVQETDKYQTALQEGERMSSQVRSECFLEVTEDNIQLETVTRLPKKDDLSDDQVLDEGNTLPNEERQQSNAVLDDSQELKSSHFPVDDYSEDSIQKQKIPSLKAPSVTVQQPPSILSADLQLLLTDTKIGGPTGSSAFQTVLEDDHGKTSKEPDVHSSAGKTQSEGQFTFFPTQIFNPILLLSQSPEESGFYCEGRISESSTKEESHCLRSEDGLTTGHDIDKSGSLLHSNENNTIKQPSGPPASPLWLPPRPSRYAGDTGAYSKARDSPAYRPLDNPLIRRATIRHKKGSYAVSGQASKRYGSTFPSATQDNLKGTRIISPVLRAGTKAPTSGSPQSGTLTRQDKIYEETESTIGQTGNKPFLDKLPEEDLIGKEMGPKSSESIVLRVKRPGGLSSESEAARSIHRRHSKLINSSSLLYQEYSDVALNQEIQRQDSPLEERDPGSPRLRRRALSSQDSYLQRLSISSADSLWQDIPVIRGSSALLSMTREEQKLQEAKFELIMSEVLYLRSLNIAVDHFQHSTGLQEVLSTQDRQWLFSRLSEVRDASSDFLFDLEEEFENNMYNFQVCNVVISHEPNFRRVYLPYVTNQTYQERTYQKLMTDNPRFQQVLAKLESDPVCQRLSLKSFLILPFQRITRLRLLLQNILKRSAPGSNEELQATNAHNALEKLIRDCNESVQRMKDTEDLILLNQKIQFECKIFPLISQSRRLVKHGEVTSLEFSSLSFKWKVTTRPVYLHLFNDCLLLSRLREGGRFVVFDYAHASCVRVERCEMKLHGNQKNIFRVFLRDSAGAREASAMGREIAQEGKESEYMFRTETQSQKLRWIMALSPPKEETDFLKCHGLSQNQCLKSYKSRENDELSLDKADIIMVTQRSEDGWLHGVRLSDMQSGWFPQSHVQPISRTACLRNLEEEQRLQTARAKLQPPSSK